jgi:hypothetical protein
MPKFVEPTTLGVWTVESGETTARFKDKREIARYISKLVLEQASGRIDVDEDVGARSWFARLLGLHSRMLLGHLALEWAGNFASLIFVDDAASEHRAVDAEQPVQLDEETRLRLAHGEVEPHPVEECMSLARALKAIEEYLQSGTKPAWLKYRYVA